ncbi:putative glycine hydroxymethyltransferase [Helianthus anomalus]
MFNFCWVALLVQFYRECEVKNLDSIILGKLQPTDSFEYYDVVTTTTYKSLRGPRAGMICQNHRRRCSL